MLNFEQEVLHGDLQILYYSLGNSNTLYLNIEEDMKFTKVIIVKQKLEEIFLSETELICSVWTLKNILADLHNFYRFAHS
jgi:hypothetical protein